MANANFGFEFNSNLSEVKEAFEQTARRILTMWGMQGESFAKRLAPVDTGLLRNSITWAIEGEAANEKTYADSNGTVRGEYDGQAPNEHGSTPRRVYIGTNVEYAKYQELGSFKHKHGQSPFLRPAIDDHRLYFKVIYENEIKKPL